MLKASNGVAFRVIGGLFYLKNILNNLYYWFKVVTLHHETNQDKNIRRAKWLFSPVRLQADKTGQS
jgi:hypothetical protein